MGKNPPKAMVIGGAASGKSAFAEQFVIGQAQSRIYLATAQALDDEMRAKIADHRAARSAQGWVTLEEPLNVAERLEMLGPETPVLLDCATMWLNNIMAQNDVTTGDLRPQIDAFCDAITACKAPLTIVTNEVGQGIVPEYALARQFRNLQGNLNVSLAQRCDLVVQIVAGLPNVLKGQLLK